MGDCRKAEPGAPGVGERGDRWQWEADDTGAEASSVQIKLHCSVRPHLHKLKDKITKNFKMAAEER